MRVIMLSTALVAAGFITVSAGAQQNSREQLRLYNQQAGPVGRDERDWHQYGKYDYDRYESGQRAYYANRYYRDGRYYEAHALGRDERIYRGSGNRYYCRRSDGTTGLVEGGVLSSVLARGRSDLLDNLIGMKGGAALGQSVDRGKVVCR